MKNINEFLIKQNIEGFRLYIRFENNKKYSVVNKKDADYLIGFKNSKSTYSDSDGEFLLISIKNNTFKITNDCYGTITVYTLEKNGDLYISTSIPAIMDMYGGKLKINHNNLLRYFAFGYQLGDNQSHYSSIKVYQQKIMIEYDGFKTNLKTQKTSFFNKKEFCSYEDNKKAIENAVISKTKKIDNNNILFLMTGGKDSILSSMIFKSNNISYDTATFGIKDSLDMKYSKIRSREVFNKNNHLYNFDNLKIDYETFLSHANAQSGYGTLASTYFSIFLSKIKSLNKKYILFSEYFEATRKMPLKIDKIYNSYLTPTVVVNDYFKDKQKYEFIVKDTIESIKNQYGDAENFMPKFYFFDRNIKGGFWKAPITRSFNMIKINLSYDEIWINKNYNYLIDHGFIYEKLMKDYFKNLDLNSKNLMPNYNPNVKDIAINFNKTVYEHSDIFIDLLSLTKNKDISDVFDVIKIIDRIKNKSINAGDEWFILRLLNLIIFSSNNNIDLNFD